jgi:hypothetical protein
MPQRDECLTEVRFVEVRPTEIRAAEICTAEVCANQEHLAEVRSAEFLMAKLRV